MCVCRERGVLTVKRRVDYWGFAVLTTPEQTQPVTALLGTMGWRGVGVGGGGAHHFILFFIVFILIFLIFMFLLVSWHLVFL